MGSGETGSSGRELREKVSVLKVTADSWYKNFSANAHEVAFDKRKSAAKERIDYALLAIEVREDTPVAYMTCRELDSDSVYWQFGGSFKKGTHWSWYSYKAFATWHKDRYANVSTLIENDNQVMLKMAMKVGFKVIGVRMFNGNVLLEHHMKGNKNV